MFLGENFLGSKLTLRSNLGVHGCTYASYHAEARHDDDDLVLPDGAEAKSPSFQEIGDKRMST